MKPSEVIAMRDKLAEALYDKPGTRHAEERNLADWLIESGWVTSEP